LAGPPEKLSPRGKGDEGVLTGRLFSSLSIRANGFSRGEKKGKKLPKKKKKKGGKDLGRQLLFFSDPGGKKGSERKEGGKF